jgi:hypothetical protein
MKKSMKSKLNKLRIAFYLWKNRLHFLIQIKRTNRFFKLVISEKYKKWVTVTKYFLTLIGLVSSMFLFPSILYSFLFAIGLFTLQSFIEHSIFSYVAIYVQPLPDFELKPERWLGMSFGYAINPERTIEIPSVGMLFDDEEYARKIYNLILSWNYGEQNDKDNNINMSVVLRNDYEYVFFAYPSKDRKTVNDFFNSVETEQKKKSLTDVQFEFLAQIVLGRGCKITATSYLPTFVKKYKSGAPFYFDTFIYKNGQPQKVANLKSFYIHNLKIKKITELTRKDIEYEIIKLKNWESED